MSYMPLAAARRLQAKALPFGRQIRARRAVTLAFVAHSSIATTSSDRKDA